MHPDDRTAHARTLALRARDDEQSGRTEQALALYDDALAELECAAPSATLADVLRWKGNNYRETGQSELARAYYHRSRDASLAVDYRLGEAHALNCLGTVAHRSGALDDAQLLYNDAFLLAVRLREYDLAGRVEQNQGVLASMRGDLVGARVRYRMSLRAFERAGSQEGISHVLGNLGKLHSAQREFAEAEHCFQRGLTIARIRGDRLTESLLEVARAEAFTEARRWADADAACATALTIATERGDRIRVAEFLKLRGIAARHHERLTDARTSLEEAAALAAACDDLLLLAEVRRELGDVLLAVGERGPAVALWTKALDGFRELRAIPDERAMERRLAMTPA